MNFFYSVKCSLEDDEKVHQTFWDYGNYHRNEVSGYVYHNFCCRAAPGGMIDMVGDLSRDLTDDIVLWCTDSSMCVHDLYYAFYKGNCLGTRCVSAYPETDEEFEADLGYETRPEDEDFGQEWILVERKWD